LLSLFQSNPQSRFIQYCDQTLKLLGSELQKVNENQSIPELR
jgi:hypothetical protein